MRLLAGALSIVFLLSCQLVTLERSSSSTLNQGELEKCIDERVATLLADLGKCEARLHTFTTKRTTKIETQVEKLEKTRVEKTRIEKTEVRVVRKPPRSCAETLGMPILQKVTPVACKSGYTCLDERNEARLTANLLAWEMWYKQILACEKIP